MKQVLWLSLVLAALLAWSAAPAFARGGGHGGGHHGGGHHAGHHDAGHHGGNHYHHANWAYHNRPFSHDWYRHRGGAWGYGWGGWGWGNPWAVSSLTAAGAWLGLDNAAIYNAYEDVPNVYTSDSDTTPQFDPAPLDDVAPTSEQTPADGQAADPAQTAAATALANTGTADPPKDTAFLPLGVFTLAPAGQSEATALVQLAISKDGLVRGTYYDLLSDHDHLLRGALDKKTRQVAFTFGPQGKVVFDTSLANLTRDSGDVAVHYENGTSATWTLARYAKEPSQDEAQDDAQDDAGDEAQDEAREDHAPADDAQREDADQGPELPGAGTPAEKAAADQS